MAETVGTRQGLARPLLEAVVASAGLCLFALLAHTRLPAFLLAACGLLATTLAVQHSMRREPSIGSILGLAALSRRGTVLLVVGCLAGAGFGVLYRAVWNWPPLPADVEGFALAAAMIGATEELVYRGYVQGRLRRLGWVAAVALAALAHTAYKSALFALPETPVQIDFRFLVVWTFVGGCVFGMLREFSGGVLPPVAAHVLFDLVVYGERVEAPWWVWS
jgi:membrane protease YdiL (CAAX protease family)